MFLLRIVVWIVAIFIAIIVICQIANSARKKKIAQILPSAEKWDIHAIIRVIELYDKTAQTSNVELWVKNALEQDPSNIEAQDWAKKLKEDKERAEKYKEEAREKEHEKEEARRKNYLEKQVNYIVTQEMAGGRCNRCKNRHEGKCTDGRYELDPIGTDALARGGARKHRGDHICEYFRW